jgi:hypothetical protein
MNYDKNKYEKVLSINKGIIKSYPQKKIIVKKTRVVNNRVDFESDIVLLERVNNNKLTEQYNKRIKRMVYKAAIFYWKEFQKDFDNWLDRLANISSEDGNSLQDINKRIKIKDIKDIRHEINR